MLKISHIKNKKIAVLIIILFLLGGISFLIFNLKPHTNEELPKENQALKKAMSEYYFSQFDNLEQCTMFQEDDYEILNSDLNNDGIDEYIVSMYSLCGHPTGAGSGGGMSYDIFQKEGDKYISRGSIAGNSYSITDNITVNGWNVLYTTEKAFSNSNFIEEWNWNQKTLSYKMINKKYYVMVKTQNDDNLTYPIYSFYIGEYFMEAKPILKVSSYHVIDINNDNDILPDFGISARGYFEKDITGDNIPEIFILMEENGHGNRWYEIYRWENDSLLKIYIPGDNNWIDFDKIDYRNGFVYTTSHSNDGTWTTKYKFLDNSLIPVIEASSIKDASEALKKYVPKNYTAIDIIVETYYDLTLFYGNYSKNYNIFKLAGTLGYNEFFLPYFNTPEPSEENVSPEYEAFRLAFFDQDSPSWTFEFPWRTGSGIGGEVVGRKLIDEKTMLVYGRHGWQSYMGAAGAGCKGEGDNIDKFIFKKINGDWKISEIEKNIDRWATMEDSQTEPCVEINQDKIKKYQIN